MPDYETMTWREAIRFAKEASGLTAEQIAKRMGVRDTIVRRYLQTDEGYAPGLDKLPALCLAMENAILLRWLESQISPLRKDVSPARSRVEVLTAAARISASVGDMQRRLVESEERGIDPACARDIRSLLGDVIEDCHYAQVILAEHANHSDIRDAAPLFSLRKEIPDPAPTPWWKFWKHRG